MIRSSLSCPCTYMYHLLYVLNMYILLLIAHPCLFIPLHDTIAFTSGTRTAFGEWFNHLYFIQVHISKKINTYLTLTQYDAHTCLPWVCCVALPCLFDLACFFLSSFSSLIKNMYVVCTSVHCPSMSLHTPPWHHSLHLRTKNSIR